MNKKTLCRNVAEHCKLPPGDVLQVMEALEQEIKVALVLGEQVHWGGFLKAWITLKRPTGAAGKPLHEDNLYAKIRYILPRCEFASSFVRPLKNIPVDIAVKGWEQKNRVPLLNVVGDRKEINQVVNDPHLSVTVGKR